MIDKSRKLKKKNYEQRKTQRKIYIVRNPVGAYAGRYFMACDRRDVVPVSCRRQTNTII